jgi:transcriptional regulator with XRE-family HTH domain
MAHTVQKRLGQAVLARRGQLDLTQEEAAARAKISVRSWRDLEAGKTAVRLDVVEKVIEGLEWSWADVVDSLAPTAEDDLPPIAMRHLFEESWRRANPRERELVQASLRVLATGRPSDGEPQLDFMAALDDLRQLIAKADALANAAEDLFEQVIWVERDDERRRLNRIAQLVSATGDAMQMVVEASDRLAFELSRCIATNVKDLRRVGQ